ncbi:MAG: oligosaccharide flippase family protein [Candidatus Marinimicrobia bacterium]|nr:oligosaccharide flippase family protein [Candidatus Neomarinimicrobiota bacterium]
MPENKTKMAGIFQAFKDRGGHWVFSSMLFSKLMNFILSILIVRFLAEAVYGNISYAFSIIQIILPLAGLGLHHSLLRFGSVRREKEAKNALFIRFLINGTLYSVILMILLIAAAPLLTRRLPDSGPYLRLFSLLLLTFFLSELLLSYFRIQKNNRLYSTGLGIKSVFMLLVCSLAAFFCHGKGYVWSYTLVPLLLFIVLMPLAVKKYDLRFTQRPREKLTPFLKYGLWAGLGSIASQLVILVDTIMVANIIADSVQVAVYKVATIIPLNLLFLPMVLLKTDYVYIAENYRSGKFIKSYYKKYLAVFLAVLAMILAVWFLFSDMIMRIFGSEYAASGPIVNILMLMLAGAFLSGFLSEIS